MSATARPWRMGNKETGLCRIETADGHYTFIACTSYEDMGFETFVQKANAALIVRAVNSYDEAKAAIQYYLDSESTTAECDKRFKAVLAKMEGGR
mgnify:CR=1 FL=1